MISQENPHKVYRAPCWHLSSHRGSPKGRRAIVHSRTLCLVLPVLNMLTGQLGISLKLGLTREASFQEMETLLVPPQV